MNDFANPQLYFSFIPGIGETITLDSFDEVALLAAQAQTISTVIAYVEDWSLIDELEEDWKVLCEELNIPARVSFSIHRI